MMAAYEAEMFFRGFSDAFGTSWMRRTLIEGCVGNPTHTDERGLHVCDLAIDGEFRDRWRFAGGERDGYAVRMRTVSMVGLNRERGPVCGPDIGIRQRKRDGERIAEHDDSAADPAGNHRGPNVHSDGLAGGLHVRIQRECARSERQHMGGVCRR